MLLLVFNYEHVYVSAANADGCADKHCLYVVSKGGPKLYIGAIGGKFYPGDADNSGDDDVRVHVSCTSPFPLRVDMVCSLSFPL